MEKLSYAPACWISSNSPEALREFLRFREAHVATDNDGKRVFLAESDWALRYVMKTYPQIEFHFTSELSRSESLFTPGQRLFAAAC